ADRDAPTAQWRALTDGHGAIRLCRRSRLCVATWCSGRAITGDGLGAGGRAGLAAMRVARGRLSGVTATGGLVRRNFDGQFTQYATAADAAKGPGAGIGHQAFTFCAAFGRQASAACRGIGLRIAIRVDQTVAACFLQGGTCFTPAGALSLGVRERAASLNVFLVAGLG